MPWAIVPGFHDFETDISAIEMLKLEGKMKFSASIPNYYKHYGKEMHH